MCSMFMRLQRSSKSCSMNNSIFDALKRRSEGGKGKRVMMVAETARRLIALEINLFEGLSSKISVAKVVMSPDLSNAVVFVTLFPWIKAAESDIIEQLNSIENQVKKAVCDGMRLRRFKSITFKIDKTQDVANRVSQIIDNLSQSRCNNTSCVTRSCHNSDDNLDLAEEASDKSHAR